MKYIKMVIVIIQIVVITILIILLFTNMNNVELDTAYTNTIYAGSENTQKITPLQDSNILYDLKSSVNKYLIYVQEKNIDVLKKMIDEEYIQALNITEENLLSKIDNFDTTQIFTIRKVRIQQEDKVTRYYIYGTVRDDLEADPENVPEITTPEELEEYKYQLQQQEEQRAEEKDFYITLKYWQDTGNFTIMPFGFMNREQMNVSGETTDISIQIEEILYTMNNVQIKVKMQNKTQESIQLDNTVYLMGETGSSYEAIIEETLQASQEREVILQFNNNIDIPQTLQFSIDGEEIKIQL